MRFTTSRIGPGNNWSDGDILVATSLSTTYQGTSGPRNSELAYMYVYMYAAAMVEFDEAKRASNILKHGIDFTDVEPVFNDARAVTNDKLMDTNLGPEKRHITTGMDALGRIVTVVWTTRGSNQRIISARASRKKEVAHYLT